jgi:aquaporin Z
MKLLTEFVGTFLFLLVIALSAQFAGPMAPLPIGLGLIAMVYMGGHVSGAHYNPAVSLAMFIRGKVSGAEMAGYMAVQIVAGLCAFFLGHYLTGGAPALGPAQSADATKALVVELIFTMALCLVVLNVATARTTANNSFYGIAIGLTIVAAAFAGGPISGGSFNPAVSIGSFVVNGVKNGLPYDNLWVYLVGPLAGAILGALVFRFQHPAEAEIPETTE